MTLEELQLKNKEGYLTYNQYLSTDEWIAKRDKIIKRDNYHCIQCNKSATIDNVNFITKKADYIWIEEDGFELAEGNIMIPDFKIINANKHYHLEVHHKRYILNRLPWEYNNEDLITLCNHCHTEFHQNNKVPVYNEDELTMLDYEICDRCNGYGYLSEYRHVQNGVCFKCKGERYTQPLVQR